MKRAGKLTYTYTPEEVAELLKNEHRQGTSKATKFEVKFNVTAHTEGYGMSEHTTYQLSSVDVVVTEER